MRVKPLAKLCLLLLLAAKLAYRCSVGAQTIGGDRMR